MKKLFYILFAAAVILADGNASYADEWINKNPATKPSAGSVYSGGMAYIGGDEAIIFGGSNGINLLNETWIYDFSDNNWVQKNPASNPSARTGQGMAYIGGDQVLLFGGRDSSYTYLDDTWIYDLSDNTWTQKNPASKPSGRWGNAMAYTGGDQVMLFGGASGGLGPVFDDVWVYDLSDDTWTQKTFASKPVARSAHMIVPISGTQIFLFGGWDGSSEIDDTWIYDLSNSTWTQKSPVSKPSARSNYAMGCIGGNQVVLFGGYNGSYLDDTWVYNLNDNTWTQKNPSSKPSARYAHVMSHIGSGRVVLFGGSDGTSPFNDTWVWEPTPLLVELAYFKAKPVSAEKVLLQWETWSEIDNAGFHILRSDAENGFYSRITPAVIFSKSDFSLSGAEYDFEDNEVESGETYFYKLEDIDTANISTLHGPVSANVPLRGDLNKDGTVDSRDLKILSLLMKKVNLSSEELAFADLNENGRVERGDILALKQIIRNGNRQ